MGSTRTFYRLFVGSRPTRDAFLSDRASGVRDRPSDPNKVRYWEGFSVFATLEQARRLMTERASRAYMKGIVWSEESIAEMTISLKSPIIYERSFRSEGHHTVWGDPCECLKRVMAVFSTGSPNGEN